MHRRPVEAKIRLVIVVSIHIRCVIEIATLMLHNFLFLQQIYWITCCFRVSKSKYFHASLIVSFFNCSNYKHYSLKHLPDKQNNPDARSWTLLQYTIRLLSYHNRGKCVREE